MKVYRVERTCNKKGPYTGSGIDWEDYNHYCSNNHPAPADDTVLCHFYPYNNYLFGFESIKDLKSWFSVAELRKLGKESIILITIY